MSIKNVVCQVSNRMIKDKLNENMSIEDIIVWFKQLKPINNIEKRIIQRSVCILGGNLQIKNGKFENFKLKNLLDILKG